MATDFLYNNSQIIIDGPLKPKNRNVPIDARYRVNNYADIASIPYPAVGELIFVLSDENNNSEQNIYVIKSLKASYLGISDMLVDEVVTLKEFLGASDINLDNYVTTTDLTDSLNTKVDKVEGMSLVSDTEIARLANVDNYDDTTLIDLIPTSTSQLTNDSKFLSSDDTINANSINGKSFSEPMTKEEYDAITDKDPNMFYMVTDDNDTLIEGVPSYTISDANKVLSVNNDGTGTEWVIQNSGGVSEIPEEYITETELGEVTGDLATLNTTTKESLVAAINELFQSSSNVKERLVDALTGYGVEASTDESMNSIVNKVVNTLTPQEVENLIQTLDGSTLVTKEGYVLVYK